MVVLNIQSEHGRRIKDYEHILGMESNAIITKVLLPRIRLLEKEVATLREQTWPYVQAKKEDMGMRDIQELVEFFKDMDDETIMKFLRLKNKFTRNPGLLNREVDAVSRLRNNFC